MRAQREMEGAHRSGIEGIAFWAPRLPGWSRARTVLRGLEPAPEGDAPRPVPSILPAAERRRAPDTVALALEVAASACENAGCRPSSLASVFASTHGDLTISDYMSATLAADPRLISPTKFHNSVHNAPAGYWTIATGSMRAYTSVSALHDTFANGLLEALVQSTSSGERVLLVAYDIAARGPLATVAYSRGLLAVALVLGPPGSGARELSWRTRDAAGQEPTRAQPANAALVDGNALASCLPLFEALALDVPRSLMLRLSAGKMLQLDLGAAPSCAHEPCP